MENRKSIKAFYISIHAYIVSFVSNNNIFSFSRYIYIFTYVVYMCLLVFKSNVKHIINISDFHSNNICFPCSFSFLLLLSKWNTILSTVCVFRVCMQMRLVSSMMWKSTISNKFFNLLPFPYSEMTPYLHKTTSKTRYIAKKKKRYHETG